MKRRIEFALAGCTCYPFSGAISHAELIVFPCALNAAVKPLNLCASRSHGPSFGAPKITSREENVHDGIREID
jgi:hypothetical protein